ncbi:MAG: ATP-dependent helicase HrpB [Actinomycetota bacterium]|nr:ATP-dependent helicase HrpB [Actinomycetota bacterium]
MSGGIDAGDLPVLASLAELRRELADGRRAVLVAPPGAGKTTLVPLALIDEPWLAGRRIVMLEPRRLATRAAAARMADLSGTAVGELVGYQTRDERRIGPSARIEVVTEGVLTRRLQRDPELPEVGLVIFDEVHERNIFTDLGLALAIDVGDSIRPDLRILAMSATVDRGRLAAYLGGDGDAPPAPVVSSEGRAFPVDVRWRPGDPTADRARGRGARGRPAPRRREQRVDADVASAVLDALRDHESDVLAFLPGIAEIRRTQSLLSERLDSSIVDVRPLAGALSHQEQDAALRPSPPGRRKVVLATDIAETSLTVEGVHVIVDSGLARAPRFDAATGMTRLTTVAISRDSADQRAGRAGRTAPGVAVRLWSKIEHTSRAAHRQPEILAVDLTGLALELAAWGGGSLRFLDPPAPRALARAGELLRSLDALDLDGHPTAIGLAMAPLPLHPRLARMVVGEPSTLACILAALLDDRDVLRGRSDELPVDLALRVGVVLGRGDDRADRRAVEATRQRAKDIARRAGILFDTDSVDVERSGAVLLLAYPDRLAGRRRPGQFQLRTGQGAMIPPGDPLADEAFVIAADLDGHRTRARIRHAAALSADDVATALADRVVEQRQLVWDGARDDLVLEVERRLDGLRLGVQQRRPEPGDATTAALTARVRATRLGALNWSPAAEQLRHRIAFARRTLVEPWPNVDDDALLSGLDGWLTPYLAGATGRADLERVDVRVLLRALLPWPLGVELDEMAPASFVLPTGQTAPIDYSQEVPSAAVRVQDLFGVARHPAVAGGHVPIVLQLLSPADRPIQVTADLPGFWSGSWAEVRKEMAGRYPKHQWPHDPAGARPRRLKDR